LLGIESIREEKLLELHTFMLKTFKVLSCIIDSLKTGYKNILSSFIFVGT
jgi:hypothetical protein